jgi:RNA polymerase sigma factor (sigma-70 family)
MSNTRSRHPLYQNNTVRMNMTGGGEKEEHFFAELTSLPDDFYPTMTVRLIQIAERLGVARDQCEDVAQETWVHAFDNPKQFRGEKALDELRSWLITIGHNVAVDVLRRLDRHPVQSLDASVAEQIDEAEAKRKQDAEWSECLTAWLERLRQEQPENWRLLCEHYLEGRSIRQLAAVRGWTANKTSCRIYRAIQKMHSWMSESFPDDEVAS